MYGLWVFHTFGEVLWADQLPEEGLRVMESFIWGHLRLEPEPERPRLARVGTCRCGYQEHAELQLGVTWLCDAVF